MFKIVQGLFHFPTGIFVEQTPRVTRSQSHHLFVHMHIQVAFIIPLYPVPFIIGICLLHMYLYLLLYHPLNLTFGHTCEISYCTDILCAINVRIFVEKKTKRKQSTIHIVQRAIDNLQSTLYNV